MTELVGRLAAAAGVSRAEARRIIYALFDPKKGIIPDALRTGERVRLGAFGQLSVRRRHARVGRNPATGEQIAIPSRLVIAFHPSPQLALAMGSARRRPQPQLKRKAVPTAPDATEAAPAPASPPDAGAIALPWRPLPDREGRAEPKLPLQLGGDSPTDVQFTIYRPKGIDAQTWHTLFAYVHAPSAVGDVQKDSRARLGAEAGAYGRGKGAATTVIRRGAEITVVPELAGCRFNPQRTTFTWLKDWHRAEFEVQAVRNQTGSARGRAVNGRVAFFVGPVLVGEVEIWSHLSNEASEVDGPPESASSGAYRRIFVSYAHQDANIVESLARAYRALGDTYLRDVTALRSGEEWNPALLRMVDLADVFQLCWSRAAKRSRYVKQEWRHALGLGRKTPFIRPTYWEVPMPAPPRELKSIHFTRLQLD